MAAATPPSQEPSATTPASAVDNVNEHLPLGPYGTNESGDVLSPTQSFEELELAPRQAFHGEAPAKGENLNSSNASVDDTVLVIYTGGTIGMRKNASGAWEPKKGYLTEQLGHLQGSSGIPRFRVIEYDPLLDSSDMEPEDWVKIAVDIEHHYSMYCGFVVLHGTDTMAYTSSALSFMLQNLAKPVVMTGSQIPFCEPMTDGRRSIITALCIAAYSKIPEVMVFFDQALFRGNRVTKQDAVALTGFASYNHPELAISQTRLKILRHLTLDIPVDEMGNRLPLVVHKTLVKEVVAVHLIPGFSSSVLRAISEVATLRGVVLLAYGAGNAPTSTASGLTQFVASCVARGVVVVVCSQCNRGSVDMDHYVTGRTLRSAGAVSGYDMTVEAAATKLSWLLGLGISPELVGRLMSTNIVGELTADGDDQPSHYIYEAATSAKPTWSELKRSSSLNFSDTIL